MTDQINVAADSLTGPNSTGVCYTYTSRNQKSVFMLSTRYSTDPAVLHKVQDERERAAGISDLPHIMFSSILDYTRRAYLIESSRILAYRSR